MTPRSHPQLIQDILERIQRIKYSEELLATAEKVMNEESAQSAFDSILYNLVVIGEAVKNIAIQMRKNNPNINWENITGMRNILAHQYFRIDTKQVRITLDMPLEELRLACLSEKI